MQVKYCEETEQVQKAKDLRQEEAWKIAVRKEAVAVLGQDPTDIVSAQTVQKGCLINQELPVTR